MEDEISQKILKILKGAREPLETRDIEKQIPSATRTKVMYRLNDLRGEGKIKGKRIGGGKGNWVWWV